MLADATATLYLLLL